MQEIQPCQVRGNLVYEDIELNSRMKHLGTLNKTCRMQNKIDDHHRHERISPGPTSSENDPARYQRAGGPEQVAHHVERHPTDVQRMIVIVVVTAMEDAKGDDVGDEAHGRDPEHEAGLDGSRRIQPDFPDGCRAAGTGHRPQGGRAALIQEQLQHGTRLRRGRARAKSRCRLSVELPLVRF